MSLFSLMFNGVGLLFPLLVTLLTQPRLLDEWSNSYALQVWTRVTPQSYFLSKALGAASVASGVFFALTAVSFGLARLTYTDNGYQVPLAGAIEFRFPLSQLWGVSPALYIVAYCVWVALVAGAVAILSTLLTAVTSNKFVALAAPFILWTGVNFALAVLRLEAFSLPPFRFQITQQPVWTEVVGLCGIVLAIMMLYRFVHGQRYQTAGIVRS
ncbi:hypothetical protein [Occultella kanbiaonis]|uniref:hypothetical protein n=1 Tax=Occultella kanbiaonis TaxID=2675754 RepID=UPI0013D15A35|nr:hypothetical protein [Occultella kanbiaonis]